MPCRLLLLDDHPTLTRGLAALLGQEPDLEVTGLFATGEALLSFLAATPPPAADLVLLDLYLPPPLDGLTLLPRLRRGWPALRVLVFSSAASPVLVSQVAAAGAHGFLDKSAEAGALLAAIRAVHTGQLVFPARVRARPLPGAPLTQPPDRNPANLAADALLRLHQLSAREREIIGLVREGLSTRAIAERLSLAELTVSTHRRNLMHKLGVHSVAELVRFAHEHGF
ncbi:LuxR C-terminal-related transcriptional regulator [Hymenobacter cheonanensis]|uniref:LuxR C-terminal-related transcriptional regulator n=1 Tax=Hymenobacter sp. CA2-7 TaxID=3063993 RepID=UPI0027132CAA|nr:response regulator transcription factor [Hymenobacter sp. CA2-7]MDO7884229.1 response regulator transcription factor [Hymenobacter sp. CA2-7]